ncbi:MULTISPECIES: PhnD/SsuA/transferrin family substrate-binding protein [Mannheimia]|uniref:histidine kinase n=1 Tax=Mannheimia pernigra TaxID=111844 RepID=A0ABD7A8M8_9PAST|nr:MULTISPECIES: PhnD/SsuA/transferrin family substrate-binding protein [Mannheimia]QLB42565.1 PhnD/SsuA/transferrin family substrate-binding protein [Mannheimia pernigra]QTM00205.1 PhnD/SsuA/transferrin family substrate-binding protein [Mannheimia sp. ZY171111]
MKRLLLFLLFLSHTVWAETYQIGILAQRGEAYTRTHWQPWVDWLNGQFPNEQFELVPLGLGEANSRAELDFLLTNQAQFFYLSRQNVRWLATLNSPHSADGGSVGSSIWVRADSPYQRLTDLKGKTLSAVDNDAFGGFLLGYYEFHRQGMQQNRDFDVQFSGFPVDNTLFLLAENQVEAAIAPICLMEDLAKEGKIKRSDFRLILQNPQARGCEASTELLPNWSLAAMPNVPNALVAQISTALLASQSPDLPRWTPPFSSFQADLILRELYRHPQQKSLWDTVLDWVRLNQFGLLAVAAFILFNLAALRYQVYRKSKALRAAHRKMQQYQQELATADRLTLLGEMSTGFAHELKQPLSAIRMYAEGLKNQTNDSYQRLILDKLIAQVDRSTNTMQAIRDWAKKRPSGEPQAVVLNELIAKVVEFVSVENRQNATIHLFSDNTFSLNINSTVLEQVITNCLLNALQAGATAIEICLQTVENELKITIEDDAGGFSQSQLDFPFVPFRTDKPHGLGLGLVLCQRLMQTLGGGIELANGEQGARVTLSIPHT